MPWLSAALRQPHTVGEDADVLAQSAPLVEHVAAHMRPRGEQLAERIADGRAFRLHWSVRHHLA